MKKILALSVCLLIMISCVVTGVGSAVAYAAKYEASPESDFIAFDGVIEEYIGPGGDVVIPAEIDGVPTVEIAQSAFELNTDITSIVFPEGIEKIGHEAFRHCSNLVKIEFPYSLYEVGGDTFNSTGVNEITIPGNLTKIPYDMFCGCKGLTEIKISNGVKEIHQGAFGLTSPNRVIIPESVDLVMAKSFMYLFSDGNVEFIICNPDLELGVQVKTGLWEQMMKGNWAEEKSHVFFSSADSNESIKVVVPKGSAIEEYVKNAEENNLIHPGDECCRKNTINVQAKDEAYFEKIAEEVAEYSIEDARADLTFGSDATASDGDDNSGDDDADDNTDSGKTSSKDTNKNSSTTTTVVEEGDNSMMWIILAVVGGVFLLLIIGVVVFAVIFLKKPAKKENPVKEESVEELKARLAALENNSDEVAEESKTEDAE